MMTAANKPDELVLEYLQAKADAERAQLLADELGKQVIKQMEADQRKWYKWIDETGFRHTVTYVQAHTTEIDEVGLRKAMGARFFDRYTKRVLNRRAMEVAMDKGEVDPVLVSRFVTTVPRKPFVKHTETPVEEPL